MQEIIQSFFKERSLVNHQIASYDDCIPAGDNMLSRMEKIIRNIRVGIDGEIDDDEGGFIKLDVVDQDIVIRLKNIQLGEPTIREANGSEHPSTPMECRLRKLTYMSPVTIDFQIVRNGIPSPKEEGVQVGSMPIMVRSKGVISTQHTLPVINSFIQPPQTRTLTYGSNCSRKRGKTLLTLEATSSLSTELKEC